MELRAAAVGHSPVHHRRRSGSVGVRSRHVEDAEIRSGRQLPVCLGHVGRFSRRVLGRPWACRGSGRQLLRGRGRQRPRPEIPAAARREPGVSGREAGVRGLGNPITFLYFLFFCSGISGLIYQVVWVRVFGNVFGNTVYSTSLVVAVFMLGLGVGSYVVGGWADRRYTARPDSLLRAYAYCELAIAGMGLGISALLPHLARLSALVSSYSREPSGWYVLSTASYLARAGIAVVLLTPITLLMGGTLTLLIRYLVRSDLDVGGWRIAVLYAVNTAGAAFGCFLTDFTLVPSIGLRSTQMAAVLFNVVAAAGALYLGSRWNLSRDGLKAVPYRRGTDG